MSNLNEVLEHSGVKGMKWGVIRNRNRLGGADGRPDASDARLKKRGKLGQRLDSMKRERQWGKLLKEIDTMSTKDIGVVKKRIDLENNLKSLSKSKVATAKDKHDYLQRHKMDNQELARKVARLQAKNSLYDSIRKASKEQRDFGNKVVQIGSSIGVKYALTKTKPSLKEFIDIASNPKPHADKAQKDVYDKIATKNELAADIFNMAVNSRKSKDKKS